jgi:acyl transferase domain-containing protein/acyl carrier protein
MSSTVNINYRPLLENALQQLRNMRSAVDKIEQAQTEPIAIIGMGCRFPGSANNPDAYWQLLRNGTDAIAQIPSERWDVDNYYNPDPDMPGKMYTKYGGFLDEVDKFDAHFFGIAPREAISLDPQQRLLLEVSWSALEHAAIAPEQLNGSPTGVFIGLSIDDYSQLSFYSDDKTKIDAYNTLSILRSMAAGRLAYVLGLQGSTMQLDTACSSSLLAVDLACENLRTGKCNLALAGGVNLILSPETFIGLSKLKALSPDGRCKTFDANANGYGRGEGCGVVILKRLSDAVANNDNILAVIRGSANNHDGASNGLTAPNGSAQKALLLKALENANVKPSQIQYVETHGTGTPLGDPIEVEALASILSQGRNTDENLAIGSVKTQLGHLESAAGIAGLIKVVLALQHAEIPPNLHFQQPNPHIAWDEYPITVPTKLTKWDSQGGKRLAGVSSFGMSGTNVHLILESAPNIKSVQSKVERPLHLLSLSAKTQEALVSLANNYKSFLSSHTEISLADICFTANTGRSHFEHRLALIAESSDNLRQQLSDFSSKNTGITAQLPNKNRPKIAFIFVGEGTYVGMGRELYETQPTFRKIIDKCDEILRSYLEQPLLSVLFGKAGTLLNDAAYAQPALFALEYALAELWKSWGIEPDVVRGGKLGEYVAACVKGSLSLEDGLKSISKPNNLENSFKNQEKTAKLISRIENLHQEGYEVSVEISPKTSDWQQLLENLGQLYIRGASINWSAFDKDYSRSKLALPTYPFQRQRYWVETSKQNVVHNDIKNNSKLLHPLLGNRLRLPFSEEIRFETEFSSNSPAYLDDHRLYGKVIVPSATYISMVLSAVKETLGNKSCIIEELMLTNPLICTDDTTQTVQLVLKPQKIGANSFDSLNDFQIISLQDTEVGNKVTAWITHITGKVSQISSTIIPQINVEQIRARCNQALSGKEFYDSYKEMGYDWGNSFQWMDKIWTGNDEALCQMKIPQLQDEISDYQLYPGLIDSCLQLLNCCSPNKSVENQQDYIYVPFRIASFKFYGSANLDSQLWCYAQKQISQNQSLIGNISLFDQNGKLIAEIIGFEARKARRESILQNTTKDLENLLYSVDWRSKTLETIQPITSEKISSWLIFTQENGIGVQLGQLLKERGDRCVLVTPGSEYRAFKDKEQISINPNSPQDFQRLFEDSNQNNQTTRCGIVYLWSLDDTQISDCGSVLHLVQALVKAELSQSHRLWLVTKGTQAVEPSSAPLRISQAALWGMGKVIALEHSELSCVRLDLDPAEDVNLQDLLKELLYPDKEEEIALRQGIRKVSRLVRYHTQNSAEQLVFNKDSTYLITGGLGALGLVVARWMVEQGVRYLVLTGRSKLTNDTENAITHLEQAGAKVLVMQADVSKQKDVATVLAKIQTYYPPLRGIFHAAGVLDDGLLLQQTWERFQQVMAPKVAGAWNLHTLTKDIPLDYFVCFSSVASLLGSPSQSNYAAANAFMDTLVHYRRACGLPGLSINWGPWSSVGMAAKLDSRDRERMAENGFVAITPEQGLQALSNLLRDATQVGVMSVNWSKFLGQFSLLEQPRLFDDFSHQLKVNGETTITKDSEFLNQLQLATQSNRQNLLIARLQIEVVQIMRFDSSYYPNPQQGFFDMGMDSLMAVELEKRLERILGNSLPATLTFKYSTIESLAEYLLNNEISFDTAQKAEVEVEYLAKVEPVSELFASIQQLSEDELARLIDQELSALTRI